MGTGGSILGAGGVKLSTHLNIVPKLRMCGVTPPLPTRLNGVVLS
jgi:hypothetical protein